ncbi:hypothetical protein QBC32DRAFT_212154 [Pseudoneurospora amorphoporcata]|uniref:Uncharacterized protein n=1 Tax=Pseudoneurospora amorphoporcata TaxID=241081 RepID=A0AAN6NWZ5_9PEZI|nr:hypothetical protein QBC32DRAFT_212154 [Pseudoneurospora amorphoporcata]
MGLLDEIIGGGGGGVRPKTPQQLQQTYIYPSPRPGPGDNLLLPPPYPGTPGLESKLKLPTLHHPSSSLSLLSNVPRPSSTNASSTTLWSPTTDPSFQELPCTETGATASQPINNAYIRPNTAIHKPSPSRTIFDQVGVGLLYGDGRDHTKSPSLQTSTSTSPRSELPELGPGPVTATTTRNTLIYNNQHTHNHNYQCHHHHHHHHHNNHNYQSQNQNYNQMGGMPQQQQPQPQPQYGCNCAWQKGNVNVRVVTAINEGEPQELSSVMTSPEPVELP